MKLLYSSTPPPLLFVPLVPPTPLVPPPHFVLPIGSSVAQSTALPSLGTAWHLANPLKASLRPLI